MDYQNVWGKVLEDGEEIKHEFSISSRYLNAWFIFWTLFVFSKYDPKDFSGGLMFLGMVAFYLYYYKKKSRVYAFTDRRIIIHTGWLSTEMISIDYNQITDIKVEESFLGKMICKTGVLQIATAGTGRPPVRLNHVEEPYELKKKLGSLRGNNNHQDKAIVGKDNYLNKKDEIAAVNKKYGMEVSVSQIKKDIKKDIKKNLNPLRWIPGVKNVLSMKDGLKSEKQMKEWSREIKEINKRYKENNL